MFLKMWKRPDVRMVARNMSLGLFTSILQNHFLAPIMDCCLTSLQILTSFQSNSAHLLLSNTLKIEILACISLLKLWIFVQNKQVHAGM